METVREMNTTVKTLLITFAVGVAFVLWTVGAYWLGKRSMPVIEKTTVDTVVIREVIRDTVLVPRDRYITRIDTIWMPVHGDTVKVWVDVPIERTVYETDNYRATIEGFRASLIDMQVYRQTQYITKTELQRVSGRRRWGLGIQVGYGYNFNKFYPYIGIGVSYNVIIW